MPKRQELLQQIGVDEASWERYLVTMLPGFALQKIEKDFFLTIILHHIAKSYPELVFKGGTCLNKCYFGYYRLSEDLDFTILNDGSRKKRNELMTSIFDDLGVFLQGLGMILSDSRKRDECRFGGMRWQYASLLDGQYETIQFDFKTLANYELPLVRRSIQSIFLDPLTEQNIFPTHTIQCISLEEAIAEKMRAALTRKQPAIRDFYDLYYAREQGFDFDTIQDLIALKVAEVGKVVLDDEKFKLLEKQIVTDLEPVLGGDDTFDLKEIWKRIEIINGRL